MIPRQSRVRASQAIMTQAVCRGAAGSASAALPTILTPSRALRNKPRHDERHAIDVGQREFGAQGRLDLTGRMGDVGFFGGRHRAFNVNQALDVFIGEKPHDGVGFLRSMVKREKMGGSSIAEGSVKTNWLEPGRYVDASASRHQI